MNSPPRTRAINSANRAYEYTDAAGAVEFIVCRWNATADKPKKFAQYHVDVAANAWVAKAPPAMRPDGSAYLRPLYDLPVVLGSPDAPVLVVEGEKTWAGAAKYLPDGWRVTTWAGGVNGIDKTDWMPLAGRRVVIWPDNDEPGMKAAHKIAGITGGWVIPLPDTLPPKWDLGDALPDGFAEDHITAMMAREKPDAPAEIPRPEHINGVEMPSYLALGSDGNRAFYFLTVHSGKVMERTSGELRKYDGCMDLITDQGYWARRYAGERGTDFKRAGDDLITECRARGLFDPTLARGRGVWLDPLGVIVHTGNALFLDGQPNHPVRLKSKHFYPLKTRIFPDFSAPSMTDAEGKHVRDVCAMLRWEKPLYGLFLAGLIATAPICGALRWRTHGWVTGARGCGKTYVLDDIVGKLLEHVALKVLGETTAPGIRSGLDNDARPVVFDESEGETQAGQHRIDDIIGLMRAASRQTEAKILKGSSNHKSVSFDIQAQFICGAINTGLKRAADSSRTLILTLKGNTNITDADRRASTEHFAALEAAVKKFPGDISVRLTKRMASLVPVVRANADLFMRIIARRFADARIGDQVGTVLAGAWALTSRDILTEDAALKILSGIKWESLTQGPSTDDGQTMINHLVSHRVVVRNSNGVAHDRTIGELIGRAANAVSDINIDPKSANDALMRAGIRMEPGASDIQGFCVARRHPYLDKLFETSDYPGGYATFFSRCHGAEQRDPIRFAGVQSRAIWLPLDTLIGVDPIAETAQLPLAWVVEGEPETVE